VITGVRTIEEYQRDMGTSDKHALRSHLTGLLEHLLKLNLTQGQILSENRKLWQDEVDEHRARLLNLITRHPGVKSEFSRINYGRI
jgi:hypothetical protein